MRSVDLRNVSPWPPGFCGYGPNTPYDVRYSYPFLGPVVSVPARRDLPEPSREWMVDSMMGNLTGYFAKTLVIGLQSGKRRLLCILYGRGFQRTREIFSEGTYMLPTSGATSTMGSWESSTRLLRPTGNRTAT